MCFALRSGSQLQKMCKLRRQTLQHSNLQQFCHLQSSIRQLKGHWSRGFLCENPSFELEEAVAGQHPREVSCYNSGEGGSWLLPENGVFHLEFLH